MFKKNDKREKNEDFFAAIESTGEQLEEFKGIAVDQYISEFQSSATEVREKISEILEEARTLKLGIVGEVKAGKSSFLNALLFEGKEILPKAPTPMTAALTKLSYSENPETRIHFYSQTDWGVIVKNAEEYTSAVDREYASYCDDYNRKVKEQNSKTSRIGLPVGPSSAIGKPLPAQKTKEEFERANQSKFPSEARACHELVKMASNIDVYNYLSDEPLIISANDSNDYMQSLQEYVGSKGKFTPIVKYTEIQLDNDMLKGIEVIDTPGMNDPVISRSRVTAKFLMECDAVFMLSYVGQFLGQEDISFLTSMLPKDGVSHAVIIGSKFDSGVLDYTVNGATFEQAYRASRANFKSQARANLADFIKNGDNSPLIQSLSNSEPQFVSSLMYSAAKHKMAGQPYSTEEDHIIGQFLKRFPGFRDDVNMLLNFANIDDVRENTFNNVKSRKEDILAERRSTIVQAQLGHFLGILEDMAIKNGANINDLKNSDVDSLEERLKSITNNLNSARANVRSLFSTAATTIRQASNDIVIDVMKGSGNFLDISVESSSNTTHHSHTTGHLWWKKTEHWDEVVTHHTANISDLQTNIINYKTKSMSIINDHFKSMLKIDDLKREIKQAIVGLFDMSSSDFDESVILQPLDDALKRITVPSLDFGVDKYLGMIDTKLSGKVRGAVVKDDDIPCLKTAQNEIFEAMKADMSKEISRQCDSVVASLEKQSGSFIDNIQSQIDESIRGIQAMLTDKRANLSRMEKLRDTIKSAKATLAKLG